MKGEKLYKEAQLLMEFLYAQVYFYKGKTYTKEDLYDIYLSLLRNSAYKGYPMALYDFAQTFEDVNFMGSGHDVKKCVYWYTKACEKDVPEAFNSLATYYEEGHGVDQDLDKALELYKRGAELGDVDAMNYYEIFSKQVKEKDKSWFLRENWLQREGIDIDLELD